MLKLKARSNIGYDTLTRDPANIPDPVTCDPVLSLVQMMSTGSDSYPFTPAVQQDYPLQRSAM